MHYVFFEMRQWILGFILAGIALGMLPSGKLRADETSQPPKAEVSQEAQMQTVVQDNKAFALQLYAQLKKQQGNLIFSPYSISSALAMTYVGASGVTFDEMQRALHFSLGQQETLNAFSKLNRFFTTHTSDSDPNFRLLLANSLWVQSGFSLLPSFVDKISGSFLSVLRSVDFANQTEAARTEINQWVKEHTQGRIVDLLQSRDIKPSTRTVLVSAIYLKASWQTVFESKNTQQAPFIALDRTSTVSMMDNTSMYSLYKDDSFAMVEIPYKIAGMSSPKLAMLVLLPHDKNEIGSLENQLTDVSLGQWIDSMKRQRVHLLLPKFTFAEGFSLNDVLKQLGMTSAFIPNQADFSKMTGNKDLMIGQVAHKAFIVVDENGTEAAAATSVSMNLTAVYEPELPYEFRADHPFVFVIYEKSTGSILFMGRVMSP